MVAPRSRRLLLALAALVLAVGGGELGIRLTDYDLRWVRGVLYYQAVELSVHRVDEDLVLHYGLRPGAYQGSDGDAHPTTITVDALGLRGPTHPAVKGEGAYRVLFGGGSTVYGTHVSDRDTLPARLGVWLDAEVWNLGVSAYVEAQQLRLTRRVLDQLDGVDLIVQMVTNPGRRAFLAGAPLSRAELARHLRDDPGFIDENLPGPPWLSAPWHSALLRTSGAWRAWTAVQAGRLPAASPRRDPSRCLDAELAAFRAAVDERGIPVVYVRWPHGVRSCEGCWSGDAQIDLVAEGLPADTGLHPPAAVLDEGARLLAGALRARGYGM